MTITCDYCGSPATLEDSKVVYGKSYGPIYICRCVPGDIAYVGCHKGTEEPLGRLANLNLRQWKIKAHWAFDPLWKKGLISRGRAYRWLADELGIPKEECHIGMFDVQMCKRVVELSVIKLMKIGG